MQTVMDFMKAAVAIITSLIVFVFLILIVVAQAGCPIPKCSGPDGDIWMGPFVFSFIGIPAILLLALMIFISRRR
ncbi:hypothetical protein QA648_20800 (plasmid) [Rhizobium sp. CB3171]|uniref:hypothetical protein n=1 Tax=Rhizobium sp. CB3171 TaxID=3039157 RepID=UPI0024B0549B|nr:hypothetical protein [Rhizobium sp. CB3171]WFU05619.1 hypothetical protein QA648_20800 [Rhizobium sp. CB3171]